MRALTRTAALFLSLFIAQDVLADLSMGVFPRRPAPDTVASFTPLAEHLSNALGEKVQLKVFKDFPAFWQALQAGELDIVHYNQYHYITSKSLGYDVFATNEEFGQSTIAGALVVRKDSGIKSVDDLRGKTILFGGGAKAMGSYIAPLAALKKHGLDREKDFTTKFSTNPPSAVIGVYNKAADAAGCGDVILELGVVKKAVNVDDLTVLAESERFAHLAWAVRTALPEAVRSKIQTEMTNLNSSESGKAVLAKAKVDRFSPATDGDFDKVREIVEYALGEKW